jgi:glucosamine--fructose-6-phosphate aminotransferase (isomerizing)
MCGIFGIISLSQIDENDLSTLAKHAQQRGRDSSGLMSYLDGTYLIHRADYPIMTLLKKKSLNNTSIVLGHSRLITNGLSDNQPVVREDIIVFHNGIVVNDQSIWGDLNTAQIFNVDTEVIAAIALDGLKENTPVQDIPQRVLSACEGVVACAMVLPRLGKLCLFSNNGSLYLGKKNDAWYYSSESFPLKQLGCTDVHQVTAPEFLDIPVSNQPAHISEDVSNRHDLIPSLGSIAEEERLLEFRPHQLRRCTKCILPETMPYIRFDDHGVCNYCNNYKPRNKPRPKEELFELVEPYRRKSGDDCIVPFSGGRDSCYGLHLIIKELKLKPITYTYDWGMVTDLGRRNISRMSAELGVENIIVADDIGQKRDNIKKNLTAWLRSPHLGMISILTAGDKHFFRHIETIKAQTDVSLNLWGVNPLEVTHFKSGFLGIPPDFEEKLVYSHGAMKQLRYQYLRFKAMLQSPGYFNSSLWDTLSGEYFRSFAKKTDYYHIFDYWRWDEKQIDETLAQYDWERAPDTNTTWRIGDGTAAFYNYIYYTVAGFTEHDTFRSNQIREGDISREEALVLVEDENRPRYPNVKWYLDALGMDFKDVISTVNRIPRMY